jgi:hypothetical protein
VVTAWLRLTLLGTGAMNSPRYPPAGLLVSYRRRRVMIDGGPGTEPTGPLAVWLVSDERSELRAELRALAAIHGVQPAAAATAIADLVIEPHPVVSGRSTPGTVCRSANGACPAAATGSRSFRLRIPPGAPLLALSASGAWRCSAAGHAEDDSPRLVRVRGWCGIR